ncbi:MAG: hypothetical protein QM702_11895 [Rubrivivax sp.]
MGTATIEKPAGKSAAAKRPKTGGRVKKPLQEAFERQRMAAEIATWTDDTTLTEDFAAIYLGISTAKLRELRGAINAASKHREAAGPEMIKIFDKGAKGENQPVYYKLGALRAFQKKSTYSDSFNAALAAGIRGWVSDRFPFFAEPEKRRAPLTLLANAWDFEDKDREANFKAAFDGELRFIWLTLAEAATARWRDAQRHAKLIKAGKGLLKQEIAAMSAALEASQIAVEALPSRSAGRPSTKQS